MSRRAAWPGACRRGCSCRSMLLSRVDVPMLMTMRWTWQHEQAHRVQPALATHQSRPLCRWLRRLFPPPSPPPAPPRRHSNTACSIIANHLPPPLHLPSHLHLYRSRAQHTVLLLGSLVVGKPECREPRLLTGGVCWCYCFGAIQTSGVCRPM